MTIAWLALWILSGAPPLVDGPVWWWGMTLLGAVFVDGVAFVRWTGRRSASATGVPAAATGWAPGGGIGIGVGMGASLGILFGALLRADGAMPLIVGAGTGFLIGLLLDSLASHTPSGRTGQS